MKKIQKCQFVYLILICTFLIPACATICPPDQGPRSGGYIGYKCYHEKWKRELQLLKTTFLELKEEQRLLESEKMSLLEQKKMLAEFEKKAKRIDNIISQYNKGTEEALKRKAQIEYKMKKLKIELSSKRPSQAEIARKKKEIEELSDELATLLEISMDLY